MSTLVIDDVDDALMRDLAGLAARNQLSIEAQAKQLLRQSLPIRDRARLIEIADAIAAMTPKGIMQSDSVELLREDRNR